MSFSVVTADQRSDAWRKARLGRVTSSCAADVFAKGRKPGDESVARRDLKLRLALERITGQPQEDGFVSAEMRRGTEKEAPALKAYESLTGEIARPVGFCAHDALMVGASPDGVIGKWEGLVELKAPKSATHLTYLRSQAVPKDYMAQIAHQMFVTGAQWVDWVSFDDRLPAALRVVHVRIERSSVDFAAYELAIRLFLNEVEREVEAIQELAERAAPALVTA